MRLTALPLLVLSLLLPCAQAGDNPSKAPGEGKPGKVYQWQSGDLKYEYFVPKSYDPEVGANLTFVLHGNGLDHRWTFWNHPAGEFRADDIVISPDGTSYHSGTKANEFLGEKKDAERFHEFLTEMESKWKVNQTFLYGHSQGSFFVFYYAGEYPEDVDGLCGHASGVWNWTQQGRFGHHQAIGVMHGTEDHIPYGQGWHGAQSYRDRKYPLVHLNTLYDWNHRPHHYQAELVLSWAEGMTSDRPERILACLEVLSNEKVPMGPDWSALWEVANRLATMESATEDQRAEGTRLASAVDELAGKHVAAIQKAAGKSKLKKVDKKPWVGQLIRFVEDFRGVPALASFEKDNGRTLTSLRKTGDKAYTDYYQKRERDQGKAFSAGLEMLEEGFLHYRCPQVLKQLEEWADKGKKLGISKKDLKRFDEIATAYEKGRHAGLREYDSLNRKF